LNKPITTRDGIIGTALGGAAFRREVAELISEITIVADLGSGEGGKQK
jgi:hypothetical protein